MAIGGRGADEEGRQDEHRQGCEGHSSHSPVTLVPVERTREKRQCHDKATSLKAAWSLGAPRPQRDAPSGWRAAPPVRREGRFVDRVPVPLQRILLVAGSGVPDAPASRVGPPPVDRGPAVGAEATANVPKGCPPSVAVRRGSRAPAAGSHAVPLRRDGEVRSNPAPAPRRGLAPWSLYPRRMLERTPHCGQRTPALRSRPPSLPARLHARGPCRTTRPPGAAGGPSGEKARQGTYRSVLRNAGAGSPVATSRRTRPLLSPRANAESVRGTRRASGYIASAASLQKLGRPGPTTPGWQPPLDHGQGLPIRREGHPVELPAARLVA